MALTQQERHLSKYANDSAADVLAKFNRAKRKTKALALVALFAWVAALIRIAMAYSLSLPAMMALILGAGVIIVSFECIKMAREWVELLQILTHDRDPRKLAEIVPTSIDRAPSGRRGRNMRAMLNSWSAVISQSLGKTAEADDFARKTLEASKNPSMRASALDVLASTAMQEGDAEAVSRCLDEMLKLQAAAKPGSAVRKSIDLSVYSARERIAEIQGSWGEASRFVNQMEKEIKSPLHELAVEYRRGRIAAGRGDLAAAATHYRFVAAYGHTTHMREEAQAWLDAHTTPDATGRDTTPAAQ